MKTKVRPSAVGAFVIGALGLFVLGLLVFGGVSFAPKQKVLVYFNESIHGLDLGSPVKMRGVRIGRVVDIHVRYDNATGTSTAVVLCEINPALMRDNEGKVLDLSRPERMASLVDHGLRAQLGVIGFATGLLFVELDFFPPADYPANLPPGKDDYPVIPSARSFISEFQASVAEILGKVQRIDFDGLNANLKGLLVDARRQVNSIDLKALADQWQRTGAAVETVARSPEIPRLLANLDAATVEARGALADLHTALATVNRNVDRNGKDLEASLVQLQATLKDFDAAALTLRRFVAAQQPLGDDADRALRSLSSAAESVQRLADFIERNPNALISGRKPAAAP